MHGRDFLNGFALDDDQIVDDEVHAIVANDMTAENHRRGDFTPTCDAGLFECNVHGFAICGFEKTRAEFSDDGFFITGDLGKIDDRGYVHILGRGKDLVISGGFNVYPKEIESEIDAMPGVIESAVIGVPHADFGEGVTAVVVCNKGADVSEASVLKALDGRLAKFKMPKRVFVVDELPRNAMGKVQKNILRDTYAKIYAKP